MIKTVQEIRNIADADFADCFDWYKDLANSNNRKKIEEAIEASFGEIDPDFNFSQNESEYGELYNRFSELFKEKLNFNLI